MPLTFNKKRCLDTDCIFMPCKSQSSPYCFTHAMLFFARFRLPVPDPRHADQVLHDAVKHFSQGWVIGTVDAASINYLRPFWELSGVRRN